MWSDVKVTPYSSVVGQSITLHDDSGRVIAQLSVMDPGMAGTDVKALAVEIGHRLAASNPVRGQTAHPEPNEEDRKILSEAAWEDGCRYETALEILNSGRPDLIRVKASTALAAIAKARARGER